MNMKKRVIIGYKVAEEIAAFKAQMVAPSKTVPGHLDITSLVDFQRAMSFKGYIEAEIIQSKYGYNVRYASGSPDLGLISPARGTDGSFERAFNAAKAWVEQTPTLRYVTTREILS
jgi:hypothetical protein